MGKQRPVARQLIMAVLLGTLGAILFLAGISFWGVSGTVAAVGILFWRFAGKTPPQEEMPCRSVSCCHYLEEREEYDYSSSQQH